MTLMLPIPTQEPLEAPLGPYRSAHQERMVLRLFGGLDPAQRRVRPLPTHRVVA